MSRASLLVLLAAALVCSPLVGCRTRTAGPTDPEAAVAPADPLAELRSIPDDVQAEVDLLLAPLLQAERVIDALADLPRHTAIDPSRLHRLAEAAIDGDGPPGAPTDLPAADRREVEAVLTALHRVAADLRQPDSQVERGTAKLEALRERSTALVTELLASRAAQLTDPRLPSDVAARLRAELELVAALGTDIETAIVEASHTTSSLPLMSQLALTQLAAAVRPDVAGEST